MMTMTRVSASFVAGCLAAALTNFMGDSNAPKYTPGGSEGVKFDAPNGDKCSVVVRMFDTLDGAQIACLEKAGLADSLPLQYSIQIVNDSASERSRSIIVEASGVINGVQAEPKPRISRWDGTIEESKWDEFFAAAFGAAANAARRAKERAADNRQKQDREASQA
jgi:hypothetical protein